MLGTSPGGITGTPLPARIPLSAHDRWFTSWRNRELSRLVKSGVTYLDYTGAALYPESLIQSDFHRLDHAVLGNPHSEHGPSRASTDDAERARAAILEFLDADPDEYACVLTPNASHACRIVGESFPFGPTSRLLLAADNHNSVNGIREYARERGVPAAVVPLDGELRLSGAEAALSVPVRGPSLYAYPAQSNFSGVRHPLALTAFARARGWHTLLDAAAFLPSEDLRLRHVRPDFVVLSLYKIIGYPCGVGALVARHDALGLLRRPSFAGGTVAWVSVNGGKHRMLGGAAAFEDGTLPFTSLGAVPAALAAARSAGRERLGEHLQSLTAALMGGLLNLHHTSGMPVVTILGPRTLVDRGATIALTVQDAGGATIPFWTVEADARAHGLAVRGGCFCNPGCAEHAFAFPAEQTACCLDRLGDDFTIPAFATCLGGGPVGAVRISLGLGSVQQDVDRALAFLATYQA